MCQCHPEELHAGSMEHATGDTSNDRWEKQGPVDVTGSTFVQSSLREMQGSGWSGVSPGLKDAGWTP